MRNKFSAAGLYLAALISAAYCELTPADGATSTTDPGRVHLSNSQNANKEVLELNDYVDPQSGNLWIKQKDLVLPGSGGLDIAVWRTYSMARASASMTATLNGSYRWAQLGPGWSIDVAPKISADNDWFGVSLPDQYYTQYKRNFLVELCTTKNSHAQSTASLGKLGSNGDIPKLEHVDGSVETIYSIGNNEARTKSNWKVSCINNNYIATSPQGVIYDYGNISERRIGYRFINELEAYPEGGMVARTETYLVAKTAKDVNGNQLNFKYITFGTAISPSWKMPGVGIQPLWPSGSELSNYERPAALLSQITASDGRIVDFTYDGSTGRLQRISSNSGTVVSYEHTKPDKLNSRTLSGVIYGTGERWVYQYYPGPYTTGGMTSDGYIKKDAATISARKLKSISYPSGGVVNYEYTYLTGSALVKRKNSSWSLRTASERVLKRTLSTGPQWTYSYTKGKNGSYDVTSVTGPEGQTQYKYIGPTYKISLNPDSSPEETVWMIGSLMEKIDPLGNKTEYTWQPRTITTGRDLIVDLGYAMDTVIRAADLKTKKIIRDGASYLTQYNDYDTYGFSRTKIETGPSGESRTTKYNYYHDPAKWILGKVASETSDGISITRNFDVNARPLQERRNGVATTFSYDSQGNISSKTTPRGGVYSFLDYKLGVPRLETQPEGVEIKRTVDNSGNVISETNAEGFTTSYTYDGLNRVTSITPPQGNITKVIYTPSGSTKTRGELVEKVLLDPFGREISVEIGGVVTKHQYDAYGRVIFDSNPGELIGTSYTYDALGRRIKKTYSDGTFEATSYGSQSRSVTDEKGNTTTYKFRAYGDPDKTFIVAIAAPDPYASVKIERNSADLITSVAQAGLVRYYKYNSNNYLVSIINPETGTTNYERDLEGNIISRQVGHSGVTRFEYDLLNRQISITYPGLTPSVVKTYDKNSKLLNSNSIGGNRSFSYDAAGNMTQENLAVDDKLFAIKYSYNKNDQLASLTYPHSGRVVNYSPDVLGRPTEVSGYIKEATYWPSGLLKNIIYTNGTSSSYGQNSRLWPSSFITQKTSSAATYINSAYLYDSVGNLKSIKDSADSKLNREMSYDKINRLVDIAGSWGQGNIEYDGAGNLLKQTFGDSSTIYSYDSQNRIKSIQGARTSSYSYDQYGNISTAQDNSYLYDDVPNLRCINCDNPETMIEYNYDGLNNRSTTTRASGKTYEMYDSDGKLIIELTGSKLIEYYYIGDKRIAERASL